MTKENTKDQPFHMSLSWVTFPFVYKGHQIIAQASTWSGQSRIWLDDEVVSMQRSFSLSDDHTISLPDGEQMTVRLAHNWHLFLFAEAYVDGERIYSSKAASQKSQLKTVGFLFLIGLVAGVLSYPLGKIVGRFLHDVMNVSF